MNKKTLVIVSVVVGLFLVGGGALAYTSDQNKKKDAESAAMMKKEEAAAMEKDKMAKEGDAIVKEDAMKKDGDAMMIKGSFIDYDTSKLANAEKGDVVLYFSAPWCPTCQKANKNFNASSAPDGLTLLKVDYDSSTDLKKQYGVTYQHTFVQVDKDGKQLKKWSGSTTFDQLKAEII
ncbi:thioredoxin family protein [Candidatus Saccharibacteria bacterium]|nr:thioredoxin family protein [Candidatus Saccharibacteria bacterium]